MPVKSPVKKNTRISIDVSLRDHTCIKALAAAAKTRKAMEDAKKGKTIKAIDMAELYKQLGI